MERWGSPRGISTGWYPSLHSSTTARTGAEYPRPELHAEGQLAGLHTAANDLGARVRDIEGRIVADEWTYPAPKSRVIELGPELAEQDRSRSSEWLFRGAFGFSYLETSRAASTITAELVLPLSRILPFGASRIVIRLLVFLMRQQSFLSFIPQIEESAFHSVPPTNSESLVT